MTTLTDEPRGRILTRLAFALVVVLVVVRALLLENVREIGPQTPGAPRGPGATTSLVLDWLSLLPALLVIARRFVDRSFPLRAGIAHGLLLLIALWAMLSTVWADDRFLAFVSSTRLLAAASLFWTVTQLVRRWDHLRLIAGLLVGLLLANAMHGMIAKRIDQPELAAYWEQNKTQFLQQRGWQPDDYEAIRFENKILAGELFGYNASPNTLGALVVLFMLVALAAMIQRIRDRDAPAWPVGIGLAGLSGSYLLAYSGSKAAWGALLLGAILMGLWFASRKLLARQRMLAFIVAIAAIGLAVVSVMAVGLTTGGLPEDSLNFRWRYWIGAWRVVLDHPVIGVGWANFVEHYLPVRLPQAAEEILDPHNFAVRVAAELGGVGLLLLFGWLICAAWSATRPITPDPLRERGSTGLAASGVMRGIIATLGVAWAVSSIAANDLFSPDGDSLLLVDGMKRFAMIALVAAGVALVLLRVETSDDDVPDEVHLVPDARPAPWLAVGLVVGIGMMLLQSTIDVALFQVAPLMITATLAGAATGIGWRDQPPRRESLPLIGLSAASIATLALLVAAVLPVAWAESRAAEGARAAQRRLPETAARAYQSAYESTFPLNNVDYASRAAESWLAAGPSHLNDARRWLEIATRADPSNPMAWFTKARAGAFWIQSGIAGAPSTDEVLSDFATGLAINPSDATLQLEYAELLERFGRREQAAAAIAEALRIDDALDPNEPERLDLREAGQRARLTAKLAEMRGR